MELKKLYDRLKEAYQDRNLNKITGKIIELYKNKDFSQIREITNRISKFVLIDEEKDAKCFSRLIMLYHPDRGESIRNSLDDLFERGDVHGLNQYSHILYLDYLKQIVVAVPIDTDIDYSPEYRWDDIEESRFSVIDPNADESDTYTQSIEFEKTFYNAVKLRMYGDLEMDFPTYYLEDFEEIELSSCDIEFLDGIEYCKHVVIMDLSDNSITDITDLCNLRRIEELYLSDNQLEIIDSISNLQNLKSLDLSANSIEDISPLFNLEKLEFVNIIGNDVPLAQIDELRNKGVMVMHDSI